MTDSGHFDTFLQVRLTTHDKERIKARAIEAGMKTSEYVRYRALGKRVVERFPVWHEARVPGRIESKSAFIQRRTGEMMRAAGKHPCGPCAHDAAEQEWRDSVGSQASRNDP